MRKILLLLSTMLLAGASDLWAADYTHVKLTFTRVDAGSRTATQNVSDVTVIVKDQDGNSIDGVTATLESTSITKLMTGEATALSRTGDAVLAPAKWVSAENNGGYANAQNSTIEYVFKITGLSEFSYNTAALDVYALDGGGNSQFNNGNTVRKWSFDILTGTATDALESFTSTTENDICTVTELDGGLYHKNWNLDGSANKTATSPVYVKVVLTKTDAYGCYAGLGAVDLYYTDYPAMIEAEYSKFFTEDAPEDVYFAMKNKKTTKEIYDARAAATYLAMYNEVRNNHLEAGIKYPTTGYYRIKNVSSNKYIGYGTAGYPGKGDGLIEVDANNASSVLKLTGSGGVYTLSMQGQNAKMQSERNTPVRVWTDDGANYTFTILTPGVVSISADLTDARSYLFRSSWSSENPSYVPESIITWEVSGDVAKWTLEDAETLDLSLNGPVGGNYYATLCVPFDVTLTTGISAYTLTLNDAETALTMSDALSEVPAGTPVLLKGSSASATVDIGTGYAASPLTTTSLTGTYVSKSVTGGTDYFLGNYEGTVGFYHWAGSTLVANRAYFEAGKLSGGGEVKGFGLEMDDTTVGLSSVPEPLQQENGSVYNLSGQRVAKPVRGLYIVNGKKVVVK
ncbi:MAG: hypothetical protein IJ064_00610 [Bacteroidaceae bacterium]|nr:hypothetical protein [Bacteroidaceae bacterium]